MLTRDRPELAKKAVECFRSQTYAAKRILVADNSMCPEALDGLLVDIPVGYAWSCGTYARTIGAMRNQANAVARAADIIVHWDDDDWSHPNRIAEQVALLQASGADCVGYNEMLFWRTNGEMQFDPSFGNEGFGEVTEDEDSISIETGPLIDVGEAWLYSYGPPKPTLGTSLCYWRKTWERKPFRNDLPRNGESTGEDWDFIQGLKVVACSSLIGPDKSTPERTCEPRMIARIHGGNSVKYNLEDANGTCWSRAPEWDHRVKELLG